MEFEESLDLKTYTVFFKNKEVKKVKSINRALAVKSAKSWLYNEIDKGCIPKGQKARVVLRVSDPNKECNFYAGFNPKLDANNYLLPEDEKRVLDQSKGAIRLATKSEIKKAGQKVGVITQFITVKKHRYPVKKVAGVPYIYNQNGTYYYNITAQRQKTVGTKWRKGSRNTKNSPRWKGDGRKVWDSKSIKENPTCAKKGTIVSNYKSKLVKLDSKDLESAVSEVLQRNLQKIDKSRLANQKIKKIKKVSLKIRFKKFLEFFPCLNSYKLCPVLKEGVKFLDGRILYNDEWVDQRLNGNKGELFEITRTYIRTKLS